MLIIDKKKMYKWIPCIWYPITFKVEIEALLDLKNKVNTKNKYQSSENQ